MLLEESCQSLKSLDVPGLVAQSVTQAVARRSLDGILDAWDQCCHWFVHEGDRRKARHPWPTKEPLSERHGRKEEEKWCRRLLDFSSGSQGRGFESRSGPRHLSHALDVFEASVKVIEEDGCLHLPQEKNTTIQLECLCSSLGPIVQLYVFADCNSFTSEI